jgi:large subunit ribosomal protein L21
MIMFAVIKSGGKQYTVKRDSVIKLEKLDGQAGNKVEFKSILMIGESSKPSFIGMPFVKGATVVGEIVSQLRDSKVIIFKKKRRHNYRRKNGHRQELTEIKILDILKE